jgi:pimeloyl-ACP methyl ester carboxylesterase
VGAIVAAMARDKLGGGWAKRWLSGAVIPLFCATSGCGGGGDDDDAGRSAASQLKFGDCPAALPGSTGGRSCAVVEVPLLWDEPDAERIEVLVARYLGKSAHRGQLWLLDGGPGGTGASYMEEDTLAVYASLGLDVYVPQHRGTGYSTPLECREDDDIRACGEELVTRWGDGLSGFHSVQAAKDLGHLIERSRAKDEPVFVLGVSYGTYWAQRYLQSFPKQASGVILEGVLPLGAEVWDSDEMADVAGRSVFEACRDDAECATAFGATDPEEAAREVLELADDPARRCFGEDGPDRLALRAVSTSLVAADLGHTVPGLFRRFSRCSESDQTELLAFAELAGQLLAPGGDAGYLNPVLGAQVTRTDIMASLLDFPLEQVLAKREPLVFWSGAARAEGLAELVADWPVNYSPVPGTIPEDISPVLLLNGGLDVQTPSPWARAAAATVGGTLVEFPYVGHGVNVSLASPLTAADASCSLGILRAFMDNPGGALDGSCAAAAYELDVAGHRVTSQVLATVLYGDGASMLGAPDRQARRTAARSVLRAVDRAAIERDARARLARALRSTGALPRSGVESHGWILRGGAR